MRRRYKRSKGIRRRKSLKSTNAGPVVAFVATVAGILGAIALIVFVGLPYLLPILGVKAPLPWQPTPTPAPTARPTPTPHPITTMDPVELQHEVVLPSEYNNYKWFADPYAYGEKLFFTAGRLENNSVRMDALLCLDMQTGEYEKVGAALENFSYVYPICNANWIVYFDSMEGGGGAIRAFKRDTMQTKTVKRVYAGEPKLQLDGDTLAWMERTGSRMDKLFVCDLNTLESATVRLFSNSVYGQSGISLNKGELIYAFDHEEKGANGQPTSRIYAVRLNEGKTEEYFPNTYVHDPMTNGAQWIWRDGLHSPSDSLYLSQSRAGAQVIEAGITEYGISSTFAAYSKSEEIWIYLFKDSTKVRVTPSTGEKAQLLGVSNGVIIWMDVTSRQQEVMKYARIDKG